jgi:diguanylate cyclase (GGDEF)-like protein
VRRVALRLLPGGLLLGAALALVLLPTARQWARPAVSVGIYGVTAAGILLSLRVGNLRVLLSLIVLALADQALRWAPSGGPLTTPGIVGAAVALLVPLNLAALAWTPDRGLRRSQVKLWTLIIAAQTLGVTLLLRPQTAKPARTVWRSLLEPIPLQEPVGGPALLAFGAAIALGAVRFMLRPRATEAGLLWALGAAFLGLGLGGERLIATLYLATGGLILIVALVETSHALAYGDELTGLPARRALNRLLGALGPPYAVAMVDIDHFKKFNDTYGHPAGDQLLQKVAATLGEVGGGGRPFRYGGEEFAVVFSGLSADEASPHLEVLRVAIAAVTFTVRGPDRRLSRARGKPTAGAREKVGVTVSIGVADSSAAGPAPADVVKAADEALYRAKRGGRNRLTSAPPRH